MITDYCDENRLGVGEGRAEAERPVRSNGAVISR